MWVDCSSPNLEGSLGFYREGFGWEGEMGPPEYGGYVLFTRDGKMVSGLGPTFSPDQHPAWSVYVHTTDAAGTADKVRQAGGQVVMEPMEVMDQGTMAVFTDPTGAFISVWQPNQHQGAQHVNESGGFCWNELYTRDMPAAKDFYSQVFGWGAYEHSMNGNGTMYTEFQVNGRSVSGGLNMDDVGLPAEVPPHWLTYFTVDDCDATVQKVKSLGGQVFADPMDIPMGRFAVVGDPSGATFGVIALKS